ncbi:MAG TPA: ADYC domain-containing protein [Kofleriaceae bacterium]|nr:ADYC domain-containing protein [Kofleriaceae bacterium]
MVFLALALPSAAGAAGYMNAGYMNAGYMNAGYMNAGYMNAGYMNAGYMNAGYMNGGSIGGFNLGPMMTAQGQPIDNVVVTKDYLVGSANVWEFDHFGPNWAPVNAWHYRTIEKDEFLNATFEATINDADTDQLAGYVTVKITAIKTIAGADGTTHYQHVVKWKDAQTGALTPLCGCENANPNCTAPVPATFTQGMWNYTQGTIDGGKRISGSASLLTVACAGGAISKCTSDQATTSPLTPSYSGSVSVPAYSWSHKGSWIVYPGEKITVKLSNVTGDPNLYVRWNNQATASTYSCRPNLGEAVTETCTLTVPSSAYLAYISVYGEHSTTSSATLTVSASNAAPRGLGYYGYGSTMLCTYNYMTGTSSCNTSPTTRIQSCTRMVTADYCGDGTPHTVTGRPIEVYDNFTPVVNDPDPDSTAYYFESEWTTTGANSIGTCRVDDMDLSAADPAACPVYNGTQHQIAHYTMVYNNYGQPIGCAANQQNSGVYTNRAGYLYNYNDGTFYPRQLRVSGYTMMPIVLR